MMPAWEMEGGLVLLPLESGLVMQESLNGLSRG